MKRASITGSLLYRRVNAALSNRGNPAPVLTDMVNAHIYVAFVSPNYSQHLVALSKDSNVSFILNSNSVGVCSSEQRADPLLVSRGWDE